MKKLYVQPELELLNVTASNDFLVGSPDDGIDNAEATDSMLNGGDDNGFENIFGKLDGWM